MKLHYAATITCDEIRQFVTINEVLQPDQAKPFFLRANSAFYIDIIPAIF
jgi:hypothetical protein